MAFAIALALSAGPLNVGAWAAAAEAAGIEQLAVVISAEDRAKFRKMTFGDGDEMSVAIIEDFADEYLAFETRMLQGMKSGKMTEDEGREETFKFARSIRDRLYAGSERAPDAELLALNAAQIATAKVARKRSARRCYSMFSHKVELTEADEPTQEQIDAIGQVNLTTLRAARAGRLSPVERDLPSLGDIAAASARFKEMGGDGAWLNSHFAQDQRPFSMEAQCANSILWLEAIGSLPKDMAGRLLAVGS